MCNDCKKALSSFHRNVRLEVPLAPQNHVCHLYVCMLMCGPKANTKTTEKINVVQMCTKSVLGAGSMMESFYVKVVSSIFCLKF